MKQQSFLALLYNRIYLKMGVTRVFFYFQMLRLSHQGALTA